MSSGIATDLYTLSKFDPKAPTTDKVKYYHSRTDNRFQTSRPRPSRCAPRQTVIRPTSQEVAHGPVRGAVHAEPPVQSSTTKGPRNHNITPSLRHDHYNMPSHAFWKLFTKPLIYFAVFVQLVYIAGVVSSSFGYSLFRGSDPRQHTTTTTPSLSSLPTHDGVLGVPEISKFGPKTLSLSHVFHHGAGQPGPRVRRLDIYPERALHAAALSNFGPFPIKTSPVRIDRPSIRKHESQHPISPYWISEDFQGPDIEDKMTIISFANMSEDAYKPDRTDPEWMDVDRRWNNSVPFGWADSGIRGHVFSDDQNSTIILSVKGTTVAVFEGNGTSGHDKDNDNLFGSCCCAQGGSYLWRKVCDCQTGTYTCDDTCVKEELRGPKNYYSATLELYEEVIKLYPNSNIITTGHSLGGVLASLIGLEHSIPSVSFEAYPQALAAQRLGLPTAGDISPLRKNTGGFHFGHTADPIYMGTCNGGSSFCSIAGYAFETLCHTGKKCTYDVVKDWGWRQSTSTHRLRYAIDNVYAKYDKAATCVEEDVTCVDCYLWKFEDGTHTKPGTTSVPTSTSSTRTRTETCKTPGWWGCNDATTTTQVENSTSTATTTTTTTCETPGWFGCKDQTTTTTTSASITEPTTTSTITTTCTSKGWFGRCLDDTPRTTTPAAEAVNWRTALTATQTHTPTQTTS
ncbi:alpha/beta-hydrolase [Pleomassaria siparia CBS 279.74]|uniref:triacylglycerol lipase n=1 Tax=Pleomassaria siparia CBS 279.74 TaxID=1314801 RepID=A0A6G1K9U9_9PLEO|nr:alpha/beta-hydrolase [Pleomassaria siparia CBS 279.74]